MTNIVALAGGVGGAKLADGLAQIIPPNELTILVNVGDDFEHLGLRICPDLDTVCYTLAGLASPLTGWGRAEETYHAFEQLIRLGAPGWFRLGDADLATHIERTRRLHAGQPLSQIAAEFCRAWGVRHTILPITDDDTPTIVLTAEGELPFQEYFVRRECQPRVTGFRFANHANARPAPGVLPALQAAEIVILCPSNPWVSIDPILAIPGVRPAIAEARAVVAVSPIIGGQTVKGPAAKMYAEMGITPSAQAVAEHYRGLLTGFVLDEADAALSRAVQQTNVAALVTQTLMRTASDRRRLAEETLAFALQLIANS